MDLNEIKKKHPSILFNLTNDSPELAKIIKRVINYTLVIMYLHIIKKYFDVSHKHQQHLWVID